ncbi:BLOC-3 complex member HPS4 isoform X1 [Microplitis demolitor]|uniref:BLOC-3 complex member HPS4 isoform X1 n=1 Tax=Microplitis demolitor TaxID=69319 RepID=UPI0004CD0E4E|nr:BLOC-3 complex member HPS4 isoform X1 [Microplitis demolitor]
MSLFNSIIFTRDNGNLKLVEMMIVFIYDTTRCRKEEDDPAEAVMYFHPAWVSPAQRLALAGQLMGVYQFLSTCFSSPQLINLQGGKFVLKKFSHYILAVGTDRNIQDWILERRANCLESMLKFFHCDLDTILQSFNNDRNKFTEKLYQMFETYLPILQYSANLFSNMPIIKLPSTASNVFLESMQVLQYCQETSGIFGGAIFYNNKVVATQLSADLTKQLVITDPYRIKAPADRIPTDFHLPVGVQLLRVYIQRKPTELPDDSSTKSNNISGHTDLIKKYKKSLPSGMKRDTSRIFTVPEEGEPEHTELPAVPQEFPQPKRPPSIPIGNFERKQEYKQKYQNPLTPSVCSTPLKDVNRILHGNAVSICKGTDEEKVTDKPDVKARENVDDIPDVVKEALRCKRFNKLRSAAREKFEKKNRREPWNRRSSSLTDLENTRDATEKFILSITCNINQSKTMIESPESKFPMKRSFNTITDPSYPVFRFDGRPVSQSLYDHYISSHYQELVKEQSTEFSQRSKLLTNGLGNCDKTTGLEKKNSNDENHIDGFDTVIPELPESRSNPLDVRLNSKSRQESYRRSMSLPLKSLNAPADSDDRRKSTSETGVSFDLPRRKLEGLQLTPLMSKLSLLATDERTSGFCSKETTPSEFCDLSTLSSKITRNKSENIKTSGNGDEGEEDFWLNDKEANKEGNCEKAELFICGQNNMVLFLLMENGTANNPELIHNLWKTSMNTLGHLESRLQHCLDPLPSGEHKELYSVLSVDPQWDTLDRSGLWGVTELDIVSSLHNRFCESSNLTDIIVRTDDTVIYGNQCGKTQIFYQQAVASSASGGLPTPADLMGVVPLKAKRRLERDHGIIIL